jgi:phenylalanyl-tRNA synthetase alpha chain
MKTTIEQIQHSIQNYSISDNATLEAFRIEFLGAKGELKNLYGELKNVPNEDKKEIGKLINDLRVFAEDKFSQFKESLSNSEVSEDKLDFSRPGETFPVGSHHPISLVRAEILAIFNRLGFVVSEGPEIEDDWHNFSALNFPPEHPARDMQDTFFVEKDGEREMALRTHTSSVQVRVMENQQPPIRTISP